MQISYLCDQPRFIATLTPLLVEQWPFVLSGLTVESREAKLREHLNRNGLPIAWVAHGDGDVVGTASLRVHDLEGREDLTPWLGGVYVVPAWRRRGVGAALCRTVEQKAQTLGIETLYLFTLDKQSWYLRQGWRAIAACSWRGHPGDIMHKRLNAPVTCG